MMTIFYNNEEIGISAEVAIAEYFNISLNPLYKARSNRTIVQAIKEIIPDIFKNNNIPEPLKHIAESQNPVDFLLMDNSTLSIKTNQDKLGKAAPQMVGQPTSKTYFEYFQSITGPVQSSLDYKQKTTVFKQNSINNIHLVMPIYWKNIFDCDYLIYFYNVINKNGSLSNKIAYRIFGKAGGIIKWEKSRFSFTQSIESWNESCTVKYDGVTIGEFQAHNNRDCFKFRFNMNNIESLIQIDKI